MVTWEDTVKEENDLCLLVCSEHRSKTLEGKNCDGLDCNLCMLEKQAEITGKIMYDEGFKAGRKEVVDWMRGNTYKPMHYPGDLGFSIERWQVQLKEWEV